MARCAAPPTPSLATAYPLAPSKFYGSRPGIPYNRRVYDIRDAEHGEAVLAFLRAFYKENKHMHALITTAEYNLLPPIDAELAHPFLPEPPSDDDEDNFQPRHSPARTYNA